RPVPGPPRLAEPAQRPAGRRPGVCAHPPQGRGQRHVRHRHRGRGRGEDRRGPGRRRGGRALVNSVSWLVPLPVLLPLVGAGITLAAARRTQVQRFVSMTVLTAVVAVSGYLLFAADREGPQVMHVGGWLPTEGIVLVVDRLSALMVIVSAIVTMGVLQYAIGQGRSSFDEESDGEAPLPVFHPTLLVLNAGVSTTFISGDLFHIYVGFEMLLAASFVLLTLGGTESRVRAGITYVFVS